MEITEGGGNSLLVSYDEQPCSHASVEQSFSLLTPDTIQTVSTLLIDNCAVIGFHQFAYYVTAFVSQSCQRLLCLCRAHC